MLVASNNTTELPPIPEMKEYFAIFIAAVKFETFTTTELRSDRYV